MVADEILEVDEARARFAQRVEIEIDTADEDFDQDLAAALHPYRSGQTPIMLRYENDCARALLKLGEDWQVSPSTDLLAAIDGLQGIRRVRLRY
jgi:DNA polymerase-3 subunit alpha